MDLWLMYVVMWAGIWVLVGSLVGGSRGQRTSGIIWTLLLGPIGLIIVLTLPDLKKQALEEEEAEQERRRRQAQKLRDKKEKKAAGLVCPSCSAVQASAGKFCMSCGESMTKDCGKCGEAVPVGAKFCPSCGEGATTQRAPINEGDAKSKALADRMPSKEKPASDADAKSRALADRLK